MDDGQGRAVRIGPASELTELIEHLAAHTASGCFSPGGWDGDLQYRIDLKRLVATEHARDAVPQRRSTLGALRVVERRAAAVRTVRKRSRRPTTGIAGGQVRR
jgi:hypothetical protein